MICAPCQEADHDACTDYDHPHQLYRACYCQHRPAQHDPASSNAGEEVPPGPECETM